METLEEKLVRLEKISSNYRSTSTEVKKDYIYIILPNSANINRKYNEKIVKIGRTRNVLARFLSYEKHSILIYLCCVNNSVYIEDEIMAMMKNNYKHEKKYGNEYFSGDIVEITYCINKLIENEKQKMETDVKSICTIKRKYKGHLTFSFVDYVNINNNENYNYERYNSKSNVFDFNDNKDDEDDIKDDEKYTDKELKTTENNSNTVLINNSNNKNCNQSTVKIVAYGKEDISKIPTEEIAEIFKYGYKSAIKLVELIHFNPKYPEYQNIYISNIQSSYANMYDGDKWIILYKNTLINKIYDDAKFYIENNMYDFTKTMASSKQNVLDRWLKQDEEDENDHKIKNIKNQIKLLLYEKRNMFKK